MVVLYSVLRCICTEFEAAVAPGGPAELLIACDRPVLQFKLICLFFFEDLEFFSEGRKYC